MCTCFSFLRPENHDSSLFFKSGKVFDSYHFQNHDMIMIDLLAMVTMSFKSHEMVEYAIRYFDLKYDV